MKPKTIVGEVASEVSKLPVEAVKTGIKELIKGADEKKKLSPEELARKEEERRREMAYWRRVIEEQKKVAAPAVGEGGRGAASDTQEEVREQKAEQRPIIKPPGGVSKKPGLGKIPKKGAERKDFKSA